ncbi:MAG TPA: hypothetical protein VLF43_00615 [Candidatus Saccharimonadales bacterium]|nr:hypothetical protein [Candidatus Saccharimonadales bacterium]
MSHDVLYFSLPNDKLRVEAGSRNWENAEVGPSWSILFSSTTSDRPLLAVDATRVEGDGVTSIKNSFDLEKWDDPEQARRVLHAAAFLGATLAVSFDHLAVVEFYNGSNNLPDAPKAGVLEALYELDYKPSDSGDMLRPSLRPVGVRAPAGLVRAALAPTFPVGFSLSPAEVR